MLQRFKNYAAAFKYDLPASLVVFLIALPLCLGIALGSGAPLFSGLIAGIVGGLVVGALSGSQLSVSGPAAGLTAIVVVAVGKLQVFDAFLLAVVLGGALQLIIGFLKAGIIGDYIPNCVIKGMLAAIGIILILKQLPHLVGYDADYNGNEAFLQQDGQNTFSEILHSWQYLLPGALITGGIAMVILIYWDALTKRLIFLKALPAPLIVVAISILMNALFKASMPAWTLQSSHLVNIPVAKTMNDIKSFFSFPDFSYISNVDVWITAVTIAIVASLETLLNIEAADELDTYKRVTPKNRELKAQGIGNLISGLVGGLPVTSVIVRTSANINAGAKTKMSTILHALLLMLSVLFIPGVLNLIPLSALAAILVHTGFKLSKPAVFKQFYKDGWDQFIPFMITVLAILLTDLLVGIVIGCVGGLFFVLRSNFRSAVFVVNDENKYLFRLRKDVSFLNKPIIKSKLEEVPEHSYVLIDMARADFVDRDVMEVIQDFMKHAHLKNIRVELKKSAYKNHRFKEAALVLNKP